MTIKLLAPYGPYVPGDLFKSAPNTEAGLVALGMATADTSGGVVNYTVDVLPHAQSSPWQAVTANRALGSADDGHFLAALSALTITVPSGLSPRPTVCLLPPATGQLTVSGNINGSVQAISIGPTPPASPNALQQAIGWCLCANVGSDGYTLLPNH